MAPAPMAAKPVPPAHKEIAPAPTRPEPAAWRTWHVACPAALSNSSRLDIFFVNGCLWLSIVSFADLAAAGKQPAEYPDPGLIQVVDKNKRVYGGVLPYRGKQAVTRVGQLRFGAALHDCPSLLPMSRGLESR